MGRGGVGRGRERERAAVRQKHVAKNGKEKLISTLYSTYVNNKEKY
jgi:hypothetical protein